MKFKVGDRVAAYDGCDKYRGTVTSITNGMLCVNPGSGYANGIFHPKQCRRLVKKERRRVWVNPNPTPNGAWKMPDKNNFVSLSEPPNCGWVEFVEVKKK